VARNGSEIERDDAVARHSNGIITIRGAREHNLKDINLELPRNSLIVFTGLSGSGKSSLAFDTIYAEGQRRYVESLSAYARQFLGQMDKPDVDFIDGLSPAISIDQKSTSRNPRSTVGTITEIYDYLRLLFARIGTPHCPRCGREIASQTAEQIVDQVSALAQGTRFQVLAPVVRGRKGEYKDLFRQLSQQGYARVRVDGEVYDLAEPPTLDKQKKHEIEVVVDRLVQKGDIRRRLTDSIETALQLAEGVAMIEVVPTSDEAQAGVEPETHVFSEHLACPDCGLSFDQLAPRNFSFNSPYGACEECSGLGTQLTVDPDLVLGDPELSVTEGVILPWSGGNRSDYYAQILRAVVEDQDGDPEAAWIDLPDEVKEAVLHGIDHRVHVSYRNRYGRRRSYKAHFEGVVKWLVRRHSETDSDWTRDQIEQYMREVPCPACNGQRLRPIALAVTVGGRSIAEVSALSVADADGYVADLRLSGRDEIIASRVLKEIRARLTFLLDVGLEYLTLDRPAGSLSGGEAQRIRLATQIGAGLVGVLYVLDEPSIGLHQRDNARLIETLLRLRDLGNTLIVVEHDEATIEAADHIVDIGPGAGEHGGEIVHSGTLKELMKRPESITGRYLSGELEIPIPAERRPPDPDNLVTVVGATEHNLKSIDASFPLGLFICVTGVSGSGKSTLVNETLARALMRHVYGSKDAPGRHTRVTGLDNVDKVVVVDQSPIGRTPRSNPATYTGVFDHIRRLYAKTPEAKVRGYKPGRFSFNVKGGRCEACKGDGTIKIEMHFLPDVYVPCEVCKGRRYNRETLEVHYKGRTIAEVLDMTVETALHFFENIPPIKNHLQTLTDVGLGYIRLGQPATTLSGGEAQRVKLASELKKRATGQTIYILDEPTTGLHFADIEKLLDVLHRLCDKGNTVIVIEHNLDVIKTADHVIDLGPEGGDAGGAIVAAGTPEDVADVPDSYTGKFLREFVG
jgi:excinuclease ABC subunit A